MKYNNTPLKKGKRLNVLELREASSLQAIEVEGALASLYRCFKKGLEKSVSKVIRWINGRIAIGILSTAPMLVDKVYGHILHGVS